MLLIECTYVGVLENVDVPTKALTQATFKKHNKNFWLIEFKSYLSRVIFPAWESVCTGQMFQPHQNIIDHLSKMGIIH